MLNLMIIGVTVGVLVALFEFLTIIGDTKNAYKHIFRAFFWVVLAIGCFGYHSMLTQEIEARQQITQG